MTTSESDQTIFAKPPSLSVSKLNTSSTPVKKQTRKSRKTLFSNRYSKKSAKEEEEENENNNLALKNRKVTKAKLKQTSNLNKTKLNKPVQQNKPQIFSLSNLRFKLSPKERNKDLAILKQNQNEISKETESLEDFGSILERNNFFENFENEIIVKDQEKTPVEPVRTEETNMKIARIRVQKLDEDVFKKYFEKYKQEEVVKVPEVQVQKRSRKFSFLKKTAEETKKFNENDLVFSQKPNSKDGKYFPSRVNKVHKVNDVYMYECKYFDRNESELKEEQEENIILLEDTTQENNLLRVDQIIFYEDLKKLGQGTVLSEFVCQICRFYICQLFE